VISYKTAPGKHRAFAGNGFLSPQEITALRDEMDAEVRAALNIPAPGQPEPRRLKTPAAKSVK